MINHRVTCPVPSFGLQEDDVVKEIFKMHSE